MTRGYSHLNREGVLVGVDELQPVILRVDEDGVSVIIKGHLCRSVELAGFVSGISEHAGLILVSDVDSVQAAVHDEDLVLTEAKVATLGPANIKR